MKLKILSASLAGVLGLAFFISSASAQHIFWSELDRGEIWTADANGQGAQAIVSGLLRPIGIGLDLANGHMYIAQDGVLGEPGTGGIARAPIGGGAATTLISGLSNPQMLSLDLANGHIYWSQYSGQVVRSDLDGNVDNTFVFDDAARYTALVLDFAGGRVLASDPALGPQLWIGDMVTGNPSLSPDSPFANWSTNAMAILGDDLFYTHSSDIRVNPLNDLSAGAAVTLGTHTRYGLGIAAGPDGTIYFTARNTGDLLDGAIGMFDGTTFDGNFIAAENPFGITVIPEPSTYALIFGGVFGLLVLLRRRFRK